MDSEQTEAKARIAGRLMSEEVMEESSPNSKAKDINQHLRSDMDIEDNSSDSDSGSDVDFNMHSSDTDDLPLVDKKNYPKGGATNAFHGIEYQIKLLLLYFKKADDKYYNYRLATEMDKADKFDDIVIMYQEKEGGEWNSCFVQVKHKWEGSIAYSDLISDSEKNEFALQKYFRSFCKINPLALTE